MSTVQYFGTYDLPDLSLGMADFALLRARKKIYVDKTEMIFELARSEGYYFLARPRRFGKTLLVSTFESLFKYGIRDFKDLALENLWHDTSYPVMHFDFTDCRNFRTLTEFKIKFHNMLIRATLKAGLELPDLNSPGIGSIADAFDVMLSLSDCGRGLVLLVDEYDAPLNNCLHDGHLFDEVKTELFDFYDKLKKYSSRFRFMFITGICKYKNLGIFSGTNFVTDLSLFKRYGTLLGYTKEEIEEYFRPHIQKASSLLHVSYEDCLKKMQVNYDGYCFDENAATHVFTPWSVLNFLKFPERGFQNYWYDSAGQPSILLNYIKNNSLKDPKEYGCDQLVSKNVLDSSQSISTLEDLTLLLQAGYLTIKGSDPGGKVFRLNYPNAEVAESMQRLYAEELFGKDVDTALQISSWELFAKSSPQEILATLNALLLRIDYARFPINDEASLRCDLQMYLAGGGVDVAIEKHNAFGRSDLEFAIAGRYFVIELKYARGADNVQKLLCDATEQMLKRHYGQVVKSEVQLIRMALVYAQRERQFTAAKFM